MDRRRFIRNTSMGLGVVGNLKLDKMKLSSFTPSMATEENDNILVVVQLFGGNDGINTITPYEWDAYYTLYRPRLHIPQELVHPISQKLGMAMHPNLKNGIRNGMLGLFEDGKLSIIQGVGYNNPNYSHFRSTDIWLSGIVPSNDSEPLQTGWLGRYFDVYSDGERPADPFCVQIGEYPSLMFLGKGGEKSVVLENANQLYEQAKDVEVDKLTVNGSDYYKNEFDYVNEVGIQINKYSKVIKQAFDKGKNIENYSDNLLSSQLKLVARLIDGGLKSKVYFVELGGFDTHSNQGVMDGIHSNLLDQLSTAISSFQSDIEKLGHADRVIGITASEFGRRPYENGSMGTDHGTSNVMFAFGTKVKPEILGPHFAFLPFRDHQNLTFLTDFRSIYYEIMVTWFEKSPEFAESVLGSKFPYVNKTGFIETTVEDVTLPPAPEPPQYEENENPAEGPPRSSLTNSELNPTGGIILEQDSFSVYPNPVVDRFANIHMKLYYDCKVTIYQNYVNGYELGVIHQKNYRSGLHDSFLELKGDPGLYVLRIKVNHRNHYLKVVKL